MEQVTENAGEDDAATDKEEAKGVREKEETEDEMETPSGSSELCVAVIPHGAPPRREKRKEIREKKHQHYLKGPPSPIPKFFTQDTITAWEKKPPSKGERRVRPPRFSRLLTSLSEEPLASQQKSELELLKEELEDLGPRPSLLEDLTAQNGGMPVPDVETVENEPKGPEDEVPSTSKDVEDLTAESAHSSVELKKEDLPRVPSRRVAKVYSIHSKIALPSDSVFSMPAPSGPVPSVWNMGQRISHWRLAHQRGYHIDQITQDKAQKSTIMKHERDTKAAVPLPLQEVIEEEALEILKETLKAYQKHIGVNHNLTLQLEDQAEKLHLRLKGRGVID